MKKLKVAILWHQHQPYYKYKNEFLLPWVRMHGVKDYYDIPALLYQYPNVKQTINLAPSLILQIEDYINGTVEDKIQRLTKIPADKLTIEQKNDILDNFFTLNIDNLLLPHSRFRELFEQSQNREYALTSYTSQDWLDLQVWYNLAWIGQISKKLPIAERLLQKGRDFTEDEKNLLLELHNDILSKIIPEMARLNQLGQIEISCSPMFHPILPLLINSEAALEAMPNAQLPNPIYKYPEDAKVQIMDSINYYEKLFNKKPLGMWPSEGSISEEALELIAKAGIKWAASDEGILAASLGDQYLPTYKYFPHKFQTQTSEISLFFRDHILSDKIGFVYSNWKPFDAACNFREHLFEIRNEIIKNHSEEALDYAVVPIILDGENCWEYYHENGILFLKDFFSMLGNTEELETVLFSDCLDLKTPDFLPKLQKVRAGSWINSNFSIWIGHQDDVVAWNLLSELRQLIETKKTSFSAEKLNEIMQEIYIAEGSDWFWWYGPEHNAPNKSDFDMIYRWRLAEIYNMIGETPPDDLFRPIGVKQTSSIVPPKSSISPKITGKLETHQDWKDAGIFYCNAEMSTMHQIGEIASQLYFGFDNKWIYFRIELINNLLEDEKIEFRINDIILTYQNEKLNVISNKFIDLHFAFTNYIDIAISRASLDSTLEFNLQTTSKTYKIRYPKIGSITVDIDK